MSEVPHNDIFSAISEVNEGRAKVAIEGEWGYSGAPWFQADSGWRFQVFNDCDEFDYFQTIQAPDGRSWSFQEMTDQEHMWRFYDALTEEIDNRFRAKWGIPS